ncbi:hypothetical protein BDV93DRAFT_217366 [Ceratobasidium sp. AG-I]|nr:hypothetical protein BDV93DRAFT_217366 [Ceratobasidium sp. AG-I]
MSVESDQHLTSGVQSPDLGGNNRTHPQNNSDNPPTLFSHLDDTDQAILLREAGYLCGFFVDNHDGPRRSTRQVAKRATSRPVPEFVEEHKNLTTKVLLTNTDRDASFTHQGWSASAISVTTPWIMSRIVKHNKAPNEDSWITRRMVVQRLSVNLALLDVEPVPEFEEAVLAALGKPSKFEKFQALDGIFQAWGDVIPLSFDLGVSLSITDLKANYEGMPAPTNNPSSPYNLTVSRTAEISTQGGEANFLPGGNAKEWLTETVQPHQWCQVRVTEVVPVTDLLKPEIKSQLVDLYSALLSYCPSSLGKPIEDSQYFGGSANGLKTISRLEISSRTWIDALCVVYSDGTLSDGWHDDREGRKQVFELNDGEYITEVMVWFTSDWLSALQFTTSDGRVSAHYGGSQGTPTIMTAKDGVLVGFTGGIKHRWICQIQFGGMTC